MAERKSFLVYRDWEDSFSSLSVEQMGTLFLAMFAYVNRGQLYDGGDPVVRVVFDIVRHTIDRDGEKYQKRCEQNSKNAKKRYQPQSETSFDEADAGEGGQTGFTEADAAGRGETPPEKANAGERCQTQANKADRDRDTDIDIDIDRDRDRDREKERTASLAAAGPAPAGPEAAAGKKELFSWLAARCQTVTGITPNAAQRKLLWNWYQTHGEAAMEQLFDEAKTHNAKKFGYLTAIMGRWAQTGVPADPAKNRPLRGPEPQRPLSPEQAARQQAALAKNHQQLEQLLADTAWMAQQGP